MTYPVNPKTQQPINNYRKSNKSRAKHPNAKLTWTQVREIRSLHAEGLKTEALMERFGMSRTGINSILNGITWKEDPTLQAPPETEE